MAPSHTGNSENSSGIATAGTFLELFAARVQAKPDKTVAHDVRLRGAELEATPFTYRQIDASARRAAARLARAGIRRGDRVVLCIVEGARFFSFFLGAQILGAIPVPLPSPVDFQARGAFAARIEAVFADCEPRAVVFGSAQELQALDAALVARVVALDGSVEEADGAPEAGAPVSFTQPPEGIAFLQYTSGSTASPKGVVVTHANLTANLRSMVEHTGMTPEERGFNWLPLYHDMGLIGGLLLALAAGGESYVMPTKTFVARPDAWVRAMSQFKATFACAPNFAYSLLARRLPEHALAGLDLSHWRIAFNGAEPIDQSTVDAFLARFVPLGFAPSTMYPVYGMAEATLAITFPPIGRPPRFDAVDREAIARDRRAAPIAANAPSALGFASVGVPVPGVRVRILAPDSPEELGERQVGEIVVSGPSTSPYYFRKDGQYPPAREELRTGDLGYMADGDLYIVDRLKDLIIVGGRNIVPSDVERVVAGIAGIRSGSIIAFSVRGTEGTEELCVVAGAEDAALADEGTRQAIRAAVHQLFGIFPKSLVLVPPKLVPKTSSGKVKRSACREQFVRGEFASAGVGAT